METHAGQLLQFDVVKLRWGVQLDNGKKVSLKMGSFLPVDVEVTAGQPPSSTGQEDSGSAKTSTDAGPSLLGK